MEHPYITAVTKRLDTRAAFLALGFVRKSYTDQKQFGGPYSETWENGTDEIVVTWNVEKPNVISESEKLVAKSIEACDIVLVD